MHSLGSQLKSGPITLGMKENRERRMPNIVPHAMVSIPSDMKLVLIRKYRKRNYTIGRLEIDGKYFCDTLEDTDRGWVQRAISSEDIIKQKKENNERYGSAYNRTVNAIPTGIYKVTLEKSIKEGKGGKRPYLRNVPGFEGIRIHYGENANWTNGCILVGINTSKGTLKRDENKTIFKHLLQKMEDAELEGRNITIEIRRT